MAKESRYRLISISKIQSIICTKACADGFEDMQRRKPNINRIKAAIGWEPSFTLDEILSDIIAHRRNRGEKIDSSKQCVVANTCKQIAATS